MLPNGVSQHLISYLWRQEGVICINFKSKNETKLGQPCVLFENGIYRMWYSYQQASAGHRIRYAESKDGLSWTRIDELFSIDASKSGKDSEILEIDLTFLR